MAARYPTKWGIRGGSDEYIPVKGKITKMPIKHDNHAMVASIDFGTTYSGYAFSFTTDPTDVKMNKNWGAEAGQLSYKTPTSVLLDGNGDFVAFGFEAEIQYGQMTLAQQPCELYRQFKMTLHNQKHLRRSTRVKSVGGKSEDAMVIFKHAVTYLKDHLLKAIDQSQEVKCKLMMNQIRWIITVPGIWSEESKQFMREVAHGAKLIDHIDSKNFFICLEPEAASIYCRQLKLDDFASGESTDSQLLGRTGLKYMIVDAGGGTVDITAHEIQPDGTMKELLAATGGAWGGIRVDENFIALLHCVLGKNFINRLRKENPDAWFDLRVAFEVQKRAAKPESGRALPLKLMLNYEVITKYQQMHEGRSIQDAIESANVEGVRFQSGSLALDQKTVKGLFDPVTAQIVDYIKQELRSPKARGISLLLLVGGFGEGAFLREAVVSGLAHHNIRVLCPNEAALSIVKGAVLFGHSPTIISSRIARKTYGTDALLPFDPLIHPQQRKIETDQGLVYKGFDTFVKKGQSVNVNEEKTFIDMPSFADQRVMTYEFYSSDKESVVYPDEAGVDRIGQMYVSMPDTRGGLRRKVEMKVTFGATEITVKAQEKKADGSTGSKADAKLELLVD